MKNRRLVYPVTNLKTKGFIQATEQLNPSTACSKTSKQIKALLEKYTTITTPSFNKTNLNHNITLHNKTTGPQVHAHPKRLSPEKLKKAKVEFY